MSWAKEALARGETVEIRPGDIVLAGITSISSRRETVIESTGM